MKYLKTYESWNISLAPKGMDQGFYFFLKEKFEGTNFEIAYTVGFDDENVEGVYFVEDDGIDDSDKYVAINDLRLKDEPPGATNQMVDYDASDFNIMSIENDDSFKNPTLKEYSELYNILKSCIEEYKKTEEYDKYMLGIETKKYNLL